MNAMKTITFIIFLILFISGGFSQNPSFPVKNDPGETLYAKGEILVRVKDNIPVVVAKRRGVIQTGVGSIDRLNEKWEVSQMTPVFRSAKKNSTRQMVSFPDGKTKQLEQLFNIYKVKFSEDSDANAVLAEYKSLPEVEYAELNGSAGIVAGIPASEPFSMPAKPEGQQAPDIVTPDDPLYSQQWAIPYIKADSLWDYTTGDTTQVIGILDTGVDWLHPDLANKIWINTDEIPDNGIDDDYNGFIDDVRGWDFVNDDNNPRDDNSHGTHCAGIAAAETNNGIGVAGVSWGAKIMPLKVFQSNGIGYFSQIAEGFWYASQNGCTIYSNSWSSGGESITIKLAMEYAYSTGLIVAAAGNSQYKTDWPFPPWPPTQPNFPACYNWVLGVEATDQSGNNTWFSNFDPTGPVISDGRPYGSIYYNDNDYNYEMRAPGVSFLSTVPNGQYRSYSGTSMACPLVAGSIALMKSYNPDISNEQVFAKLIQPVKINLMQAGVLNILTCTMIDPPPDLYYISNSISDSLDGGDNDGRPDAGETIDMYVTIKNAGGFGDSIYARLRFSEFEDTTVARILDSTCYLGSISAYGKNTSFDAIRIKISDNVSDARIISFQLLIYQNGETDTLYQNLTITVEHGIEIRGTYSGLLHLTGNSYYIVTGVAVIDSLIIDPGVTLRFRNTFFLVNKYLSAIGNPDSMITFKGADNAGVNGIVMGSNSYSQFEYCIFQDGASWNQYINSPSKIHNSIFRFNQNLSVLFSPINGGDYKYNVFTDNLTWGLLTLWSSSTIKYNVFANNGEPNRSNLGIYFTGWVPYPSGMDSIIDNININNRNWSAGADNTNGWPMGIYKLKQNYWGTSNLDEIKNNILDFYEDPSRPVLETDTILNSPPPECHGVTWKVEINDQNPQNTPLVVGPGPARFSVYFNRPMDTAYVPFLTFGIRFPFTQNNVSDSARWNPEHTIWTAYKTIDLSTGDGQNTIRVAYARDPEHFEIPIERSRFKFIVQAAGSQSVNFTAIPGIGKVDLEWPLSDSTNVLGYNLYRYTMPTDSTCSDTLLVNSTLLTDSIYTDFAVNPGITYYYMFTLVRTDFAESDFSKVVQATPFLAINGDANGDLLVNVLDITTVVAYMLDQDPQPFLVDAADVNGDNVINVLDIISIVDIILGKKKQVNNSSGNNTNPAYIWLDEGKIRFKSDGQVAALQFELTGQNLEQIRLLMKQQGFEFATAIVKGKLIGIIYNLENRTISSGMINLINIEGKTKPLVWGEVVAGDPEGKYVLVIKDQKDPMPAGDYELSAFPNPFKETVMITYNLPEPATVAIEVYNSQGQLIKVLENGEKQAGSHQLEWNGKSVPSGIYFCRLNGKTVEGNEVKSEVKMVLMR